MAKVCPTKVVIRRLPPSLTENEFLKIVDPLPSYSYFRFCGPDLSLGSLGLSRAYITFKDMDALFDFKERFDNYVFVDSEGNESYAQIELAVCQSLANSKDDSNIKIDKKQGTLQSVQAFINFTKSLEKASNTTGISDGDIKKTPLESILEAIQNRESNLSQIKTDTPLVSFLNQKGSEQKRRDDENGPHSKHMKSIYSVKKKDKSGRIRSRCTNDSKQFSSEKFNSSNQEYPNRIKPDESNLSKGGKNTKSMQSALNEEEFPPMQGSTQSKSRPAQMRSDSSIWQNNVLNSENCDQPSKSKHSSAKKLNDKKYIDGAAKKTDAYGSPTLDEMDSKGQFTHDPNSRSKRKSHNYNRASSRVASKPGRSGYDLEKADHYHSYHPMADEDYNVDIHQNNPSCRSNVRGRDVRRGSNAGYDYQSNSPKDPRKSGRSNRFGPASSAEYADDSNRDHSSGNYRTGGYSRGSSWGNQGSGARRHGSHGSRGSFNNTSKNY